MLNRLFKYLKRIWFYKGISINSILLKIKEKRLVFDDELSIVCIAKNEAEYIQEWVEYHLLAGADRIYVYDNESTDNMKSILEPYIKSNKVVYIFFPGKASQLAAYNDAVKRFKYKTKYMAFIDCDEFLVSENPESSLKDVIKEIFMSNIRAGGIAVNWRMYGSSGYINRPTGLVTENFIYRGNGSRKGSDCIKTIANPRFIKEYKHVHYPKYFYGFNNINEKGEIVSDWCNPCDETNIIRINHYFTKSKDEWIVRRQIGKADSFDESNKRTIDEFYEHDFNDVYDNIMHFYIKEIKEAKYAKL